MTSNSPIVDHLFRHQYGKMVAILSRIFGLKHLELIEDAVQDTFIRATLQWRGNQPENPEAWLTQAAKNRVVDLLRKLSAEKERQAKVIHGAIALDINEYFLDHEVADSQLRMIFVACHPVFSRDEQIAFALKTISGFSMAEIAAALLQKEETVKKRLVRARKKILSGNISLTYPAPGEISVRLSGVLQVIYLIFNEGFHSTNKEALVNKEICGEALRLCRLMLQKESFRSGSLYALFALLCYHSSRLEAKVSSDNEIIDLQHQDRSKWYLPLIMLGHDALRKAQEYDITNTYYYEAAIAAEHVRAVRFEHTNWEKILMYYQEMHALMPSDNILLSIATVYLQLADWGNALEALQKISQGTLQQREYLLHGCYAEYYEKTGKPEKALDHLEKAIAGCKNSLERKYLERKRGRLG